MRKLTSVVHDSAVRNILGQGTVIKGDIELQGDFRIDGNLFGNISSQGRIVIGPTGVVEGNIVCANADISGKVAGNITTSDLTTFKASAVVSGELTTTRLAIEVGAVFNGMCSMQAAGTKAAND
ncbi:MAG TPA: polymer-forming cytoskeletal protein [Bacteroidales bacterium]|nr:polymer-forming cytoskeletal protein [Bacteroidales bacterium]